MSPYYLTRSKLHIRLINYCVCLRGFELAGNGPAGHDAHAAFEGLFGLIAARQAGDLASALCSCQSLVAPPVVGEALRLAGRFGRALTELGLALPLRWRYVPWPPDPGAARHH